MLHVPYVTLDLTYVFMFDLLRYLPQGHLHKSRIQIGASIGWSNQITFDDPSPLVHKSRCQPSIYAAQIKRGGTLLARHLVFVGIIEHLVRGPLSSHIPNIQWRLRILFSSSKSTETPSGWSLLLLLLQIWWIYVLLFIDIIYLLYFYWRQLYIIELLLT